MARWLTFAFALLLSSGLRAQTPFTIDFAKPHQTIQGLGVTATGTWIPAVTDLYAKDSFAARIGDELGASIIRLALPPEVLPKEDLNTESLNLESFDFTKFSPPANFIRTMHTFDPGLKVILSIWSPPAWMKDNASTKNGGHLRPDRREHFARFCAAACLGFEKTYGVPIFALSIQNEPHFVEPYDSCIYTPAEMRDAINAVAAAFKRFNVTTRLMAPEDYADEPRWTKYLSAISASKPTPAALSMLNIHGEPGDTSGWPRLAALAKKNNLPIWMTETSGEQPTWLEHGGKPGALDLARKIHSALVNGRCEAWVYWAITDPSPSEFALMSLAEPTPKFFAARQFYRFIRPGAVRIDVAPTHPTILVSAFHHPQARTLTVVLINMGAVDQPVSLAIAHAPGGVAAFDASRSSATLNAAALDAVSVTAGQAILTLPAQSVTTLRAGIASPQ